MALKDLFKKKSPEQNSNGAESRDMEAAARKPQPPQMTTRPPDPNILFMKMLLKDAAPKVAPLSDFAIEAHAHMLYNFVNLLDNVEQLARSLALPDTSPASFLDEFLAYAEHRYKIWLDGMAGAAAYARKDFDPPWDVALVFYVHHQLPLHFKPDLATYYDKCSSWGYSLLPDGKWRAGSGDRFVVQDPRPAEWTAAVPSEPFNPWHLTLSDDFSNISYKSSTRANSASALPVPVCPSCQTETNLSYRAIRTTRPDCPACGTSLADQLFPFFGLDLTATVKSQRVFWTRLLAGAIPALDDIDNQEPSFLADPPVSSRDFLMAASGPTSDRTASNAAATNRFKNALPVPPATTVDGLVLRYMRFMALMRGTDGAMGRDGPLVPTIDIDFVWRTHKLMPREYREWCQRYMGKVVDDGALLGSSLAGVSIDRTARAWREAYGESYERGAGWVDLGGPHGDIELRGDLWDVPALWRVSKKKTPGQDGWRAEVIETRDVIARNYWLRYPRQSWYVRCTGSKRFESPPNDEDATAALLSTNRAGQGSVMNRSERRKHDTRARRAAGARAARRRRHGGPGGMGVGAGMAAGMY